MMDLLWSFRLFEDSLARFVSEAECLKDGRWFGDFGGWVEFEGGFTFGKKGFWFGDRGRRRTYVTYCIKQTTLSDVYT